MYIGEVLDIQKENEKLKQENEILKQQVNDFISQYKLAHNRYMKYQTKLKRIEDRVQDIKFDDEHNIEIMNDILQIIKEE